MKTLRANGRGELILHIIQIFCEKRDIALYINKKN